MKTHEAFAVILGGFAEFIAVLAAVGTLARQYDWGLAVIMVALIFWREFVFTGMRVELDRLRKLHR